MSLWISTTVWSSTTWVVRLAKVRLSLLVLLSPPARSNENLTASALKGSPLLELDAPAQLEGVGLEVGRDLPALGQQRRDTAVGVDLGERLEDVVVNDLGNGRGGTGGRVQPRRFQRHGQHHRVLAVLARAPQGAARGTAAMAPVARTERRFSMFEFSRRKPVEGARAGRCVADGLRAFYTIVRAAPPAGGARRARARPGSMRGTALSRARV
jgi:hypothetical protein